VLIGIEMRRNKDKRLSWAVTERPARRYLYQLNTGIGLLLYEQLKQIACQPGKHFQQLPRFIPLHGM